MKINLVLTWDRKLIITIYWFGVESRITFIAVIYCELGAMNLSSSRHESNDGTPNMHNIEQPLLATVELISLQMAATSFYSLNSVAVPYLEKY